MGRLALLISTLLLICPARADSWYIGLLSIRGDAIARSSWQPLESFLNQQMPDHRISSRCAYLSAARKCRAGSHCSGVSAGNDG